MATKLHQRTVLLAFALMTIATVGKADVQPWNVVPAKLTREINIQHALHAVPRSLGQQTVLSQPLPADGLITSTPKNLDQLPNSCSQKGGSLCYDYRSGHAMFKPMRKLLPAIPGMTPHNISIHRDKIIAQYTFK
jgi:hypothetical protein